MLLQKLSLTLLLLHLLEHCTICIRSKIGIACPFCLKTSVKKVTAKKHQTYFL